MQEIDVIHTTRGFLQQRRLLGARAVDVFTDAHPTLLSAGGSSSKGYNPDTDIWKLTAEARG